MIEPQCSQASVRVVLKPRMVQGAPQLGQRSSWAWTTATPSSPAMEPPVVAEVQVLPRDAAPDERGRRVLGVVDRGEPGVGAAQVDVGQLVALADREGRLALRARRPRD